MDWLNAWCKSIHPSAPEMAEIVFQQMLEYPENYVQPDVLTFSTLLTVLSLTTNARLDTGSLLLDDVGFFGFFGEVFDFVGDNGAVVTVARCLPLLPLTLLLLVVELSFALLELVLSFVAETPFSGRCFFGGLLLLLALLALLVMF